MAYSQAATNETLFDASDAPIAPDNLTFKDFSNTPGGQTSGRISPAALFTPDETLQRQVGSSSFFSIDYYSKYFDVDTKLVLERSWRTLYPREDYVDDVLNGTPDLYGPFWLPTTLIFVLFLSNSLSASISAYLHGLPYAYDFTRLSVAVSIVYSYAFAVPTALWAVMRYWAGVEGRTAVDIISIYGYGMVIWIPVVCIPPIEIARFAFSTVALLLSGYFLSRNIYPLLAGAPSKAARVLIIGVALLHVVLGFALWFLFLGVSAKSLSAPSSDSGTVPPPATQPSPTGDI